LNLWNEAKVGTSWSLASFWSFYADLHLRGAYYDDREMGAQGQESALQRAASTGVNVELDSDPRRRVTGLVNVDFDRRSNGFHLDGRGQITLRVLPPLELDFTPPASYDPGEPRYVANDASGAYQFGAQTAATLGATLRAAYSFSPELSLQFYTQLFLAWVRYGALASVPAGPAERISLATIAAAPLSGLAPPDTEEATLNLNLVLRWEYRLGSTLF